MLDARAGEEIRNNAKRVFLGTALSQNGRLDALIMLVSLARMIWRVSGIYNQRPTPAELWSVYSTVSSATFISFSIEALDIPRTITESMNELLPAVTPVMAASSVPLMGPMMQQCTSAVIDGAANCLLAIRAGVVTRSAFRFAALGREEARQQAEHERVLNQRAEGRRYIERIAAEHPHTPGAPLVRICWSECPAFYSWEEGALSLSVAAADIILTHYDQETVADGEHGYYKTKFVIEYTGPDDEPATYEGRYDLGDDDGGLVQHIRAFGEHLRDRSPYGNGNHLEDTAEQAAQILALADTLAAHLAPVQTARVIWAPWLTQAAALSASPASTTTPPSDDIADGEPGEDPAADLDPGSIYDAVSLLTEDQLERAILAIPYTDKARADVARFLLQELARRDMTRALAVSRRWKAGAP